jgi:hypothetical protein
VADELTKAYAETHYKVTGEVELTLRVGEANAGLAALQVKQGCSSSAFITAYNPFSQQLDDTQNQKRQASLSAELQQAGFILFDGIGSHPSGNWPGEPSFLVMGVSLEEASAIGERYEQNAIIWSGADAVPQLVMLR